MKDLLRAYFFRLKKSNYRWVTRIVLAVLAFLIPLGRGINNIQEVRYWEEKGHNYSSFPVLTSRHFLFLRSFTPLNPYWTIVRILIYFFLTTDWADKTFRNRCLAGKSRNTIFFSGLLFSFLIFLACYAFLYIPVLIMGYAFPFAERYRVVASNGLALPLLAGFLILFLYFSLFVAFAFRIHSRSACLLPFAAVIAVFFFSVILESIESSHNSELGQTTAWNFYPLREFFPTYQLNKFGFGLSGLVLEETDYDTVAKAVIVNGKRTRTLVTGRTVPLILKTLSVSLIFSSLNLFLSNRIFAKTDRK